MSFLCLGKAFTVAYVLQQPFVTIALTIWSGCCPHLLFASNEGPPNQLIGHTPKPCCKRLRGSWLALQLHTTFYGKTRLQRRRFKVATGAVASTGLLKAQRTEDLVTKFSIAD